MTALDYREPVARAEIAARLRDMREQRKAWREYSFAWPADYREGYERGIDDAMRIMRDVGKRIRRRG